MIKKLLLILSFIALVAFASSGITYAWHDPAENETLVISEEIHKLDTLYKEGIITEEEFKKAKSILLDPDSNKSKIKKIKKKKKKLTAVERRQLKDTEQEELKALKEQLRAEKKAERERIAQARMDEKKRIIKEAKKAIDIIVICANLEKLYLYICLKINIINKRETMRRSKISDVLVIKKER